jgi:hypothetical protein
LPVKAVPEAETVTRLFSNDLSADSLVGVSPSVLSVSNAVAIAASWPTVVSEASSIVWTSDLRVATAVASVELDELDELDELLSESESVVLVDEEAVLATLVVATVAAEECVEASAWCAAACKCATAWWAMP